MSEVSHHRDIATHPDLVELQERAERISASPPSVAIDGLALLAGAWLAISPWVIGFSATSPNLTVNNLILGAIVVVLAFGLTLAPARMYRMSWAMVAIGGWIIASLFVIQRSTGTPGMFWTNVITGAVVAALGFAAATVLMAVGTRHIAADVRR